MKCIIGKKLGMTTLHDAEKGARNVTLIDCGDNVVSLLRTADRDGYSAVQLETAKTEKKKMRKEFRMTTEEIASFAPGASVAVDVFSVGDRVDVIGVTKSKGFQGVVKRHGFKGQTTSHGRKHDIRKAGSIGATDPQRVFKGMRMAGRMGGENFTVQNLSIEYVDAEKKILAVRGAVPGSNGRMVCVKTVR